MNDLEAIVLMIVCMGFMFGVILGFEASLMAGSDIFGLVVSILLFVYLCYALFRGEKL